MASLEEILDKCSVAELKIAAEENKLPISGTKAELISRLASSVSAKKTLESFSNKRLQAILGKYNLPKSGTKAEMIRRILPLTKATKQKPVEATKKPVRQAPRVEEKVTAYKKGHDFEKQFARYIKRFWKPTNVIICEKRNGLHVKIPYDVDVRVYMKGRGLFARDINVWFECKNQKATIRRLDISKLVDSARDVYEAYQSNREDIYFSRLGFVSTSKYSDDAIAYANQYDVNCIEYDGKSYNEVNEVNWDDDPIWLKRLK